MSITICVNELNTAKEQSSQKQVKKESHGNVNLLKALYEESSAKHTYIPANENHTPVGQVIIDVLKQEPVFDSAKNRKKVKAVKALPALEDTLRFEDHGHVDVHVDGAVYYINFFIDKDVLSKASFYVRYGSYDDVPENWEDIQVNQDQLIQIREGHFYMACPLPALRRGWYGATCYAVDKRNGQTIWQGTGFANDAKFRINADCAEFLRSMTVDRSARINEAVELINRKITKYSDFELLINELHNNGCRNDLSQILFEATRGSEKLRNVVSQHYFEASDRLEANYSNSDAQERSHLVRTVLGNIGLGEVVLVSPEGPQATFGGVAQVMEGFIKAFSGAGLPVTLIGPLYESSQGNKHTDAATTLKRGLVINGKHAKLKYAGELDIPFGPTYRARTAHCAQQAHSIRANVYLAEVDKVRVFLIRHSRYTDKLYPRLMGDEHLRRAIFLGRGALELMKNAAFGICPQTIISNDWVSAFVPVMLKLDQRYSDNDQLRKARTIHIIHNAGKDYQGRFPNHHDNQNLFPMLELNPIHYDGLMDPHNKNFFNLTAAAIYHLNGAVLAVSKPYAQALRTTEGGDGIDKVIWHHNDAIFGISNGVDQLHLRQTVARIGEGARQDVGLGRTNDNADDVSNFFEHLISYKDAAKLRMQRNFGLHQDANKIVISLVGRLAEQKGIQLLMGNAAGEGCCVMESVLRRFGDVQFVIAGPRVDGDELSGRFCALVEHLKRCFPGRIVGIYDFVPHDFAMEVFTASDFALMPSRFEPGGLTQLEGLAAGALVIARNVGGISATLERFDDTNGKGNGFMFDDYSPTALKNTICWAIDRTRSSDFRRKLMLEAAHAEHDWSHRVPQYLSVFQHLAGVLADENSYEHLAIRKDTLAQVKA